MPQITASRATGSHGIPIGELSRLTGVNIETIRYYEKIRMLRPPPRTEGGRRIYGPTEAFSPSSDAAVSLVSVSKTSAPCSPWGDRERRLAQMCARSLRIILMTSAPRSQT